MKKVNILLIILYIVGLTISAYTLYQLPTSLMELHALDLTQLQLVQPVFDRLYLVLGSCLALGIAAIVALWLEHRQKEVKSTTMLHTDDDQSAHQGYEDDEASVGDRMLQIEGIDEIVANEEDEVAAFTQLLSLVCHQMEASQAAAYRVKRTEEYSYIELFASFAYHAADGETITYRFGEGLAGQVAKQQECIIIDTVPDGYIEIISGLGKAAPTNLIILPVTHDNEVVGVVEIASFKKISESHKSGLLAAFDQLALKLLNNDNVSLEEATS